MTLLALFADERGWLASGRRVFGADEIESLERSVDMAEALSARLAARAREDDEANRAGYAAGHERGQALALEEGRARTAETLLALERVQVEEHRRLRETAATLAVEIVRRLAAEVAPADWLAAQARVAADDLLDDRGAALRVRPERADEVRARLDAHGEHRLRILADDTLPEGGCRIETTAGHVDVDLDTQLRRLVERLDAGDVDDGGAG